MTVNEIIQLVCLATPLLGAVIGFIFSLIRSLKSGKYEELKNAVKDYVIKAEAQTNLTGSEKKQYVLDSAQDFCNKINFKFDFDLISQIIENLIDISKKVNSKNNQNENNETKE